LNGEFAARYSFLSQAGKSTEDVGATIKADMARWGKVIRAAKLRAE
jgi:hypothetical protein